MFSLFGKGKGKADEPSKHAGLSQSADLFSSAAASALAAAVNSSPAAKAAAPSTGRRLHGDDVVIQLDELRENEVVTELKVCAEAP
jgi:hypothetical protein